MGARQIGWVAALAGLALMLGAPAAFAQQPADYRWALPEWRATWSGGPLADDRGFAVEAADDGVYVAGVSGAGRGGGDALLLKYDLAGRLLWTRTWGGSELDQAQDLALAADGIYVVGSDASRGDGVSQSVVLRFPYDPQGGEPEELVFNVGAQSAAQSVVAADGALFVAGLAHPTATNRDLYVTHIEPATLARTWTKRWGGAKWDEAWALEHDGSTLFLSGYTTPADSDKTDNLLLLVDPADGRLLRQVTWGGPGNDEARALALDGDTLWVAGGGQRGTSGDAFLAELTTAGDVVDTHFASGLASGAYGVAVGEEGIYVAGGSYDFPAGGDAAILRFSRDGRVEWSQIFGQPGFWDWGFDVAARDGRFYVAGTLFTPGEQWYEILTVAYDEDLSFASLPDAVAGAAQGDPHGTRALDAFWLGDFLRWARGPKQAGETGPATATPGAWADEQPGGEQPPPGDDSALRLYWHGASDFGREPGYVYADTGRDQAVGQERAPEAFTGLARDFPSNPALVRDYTGVRGSALGGLVRFRYFISHDRLIPQGGFISVGPYTAPLPPPPV